jgi:hypothetical protein
MSGQLEIAALIDKRMRELGLSRAELAARLGYRNFAKGMRRLDEVCQGQLERHSELLARLPYALKIDPKVVYGAENKTRAQMSEAARQAAVAQEQEWRAKFKPHAIVLTESSRPSQITICDLVDGESLKFIQLDATKPRWTFIHQALRVLNKRLHERHSAVIPFFGAPTGIAINFDPDRAVRYDLDGKALEILRGAVRLGETRVSVGGRPMPRVFELG